MNVNVLASVSNGLPKVPMAPKAVKILTTLAVSVPDPDLVMLLFAETLIVPLEPVETLSLMAMEAEPVVVVMLMIPEVPVETGALIVTLAVVVSPISEIIPLPLIPSELEIVRALPDVTEMLPEVSTIVPSVTSPVALIVRFLAPRVIV